MLSAGGFASDLSHDAKPFRIVRVETSSTDADADSTEKEASQGSPSSKSEDGEEKSSEFEMVEAGPLAGGEEDCGKGVARKMTGKIGASVFRGVIVKVRFLL